MKLAGSFAAMLFLAATCWAEQPLSAGRVITPTVDPEIVRLPVVDARDIRFVRLSRSQGLSQQRVTDIVQDEHGFLWFGTQHGLNRYDGYHFRIFKNQPDDPTSLCGHYISSLFVDRGGRLWVGCAHEVDRYDPVTERFVHYRLPQHAPQQASQDDRGDAGVRHISQDRAGILWLSTEDGLYRFDPTTAATVRFGHEEGKPTSLSSDDIKSSREDGTGTFWVATGTGLDAFDREHARVTEHVPLLEPRDFSVYEDRKGVFWLLYGSGNGLAVLDRNTNHLTRYSFGRDDLSTHPLTGVSSMLEDQDGNLWIGTFSDGLLRFDREHSRFIRYRNDPANSESLPENRITTLFQDREGDIWVGLGAIEPAFFSPQPSAFEVLPFDSGNPDNLGELLVNGIYEDRAGIVWMGTTGALVRLDRKAGHISHIAVPGRGIASDVLAIVEDTAGALWIGTSGQGLYRRRLGSEHLTAFRHSDDDPSSLSADTVMRLFVDHAGTLWVGTLNGLDRFNSERQNFTTFRRTGEGESNVVRDVVEDSAGTLVVGTDPSGVLLFDPRSGSFTPVSGAQQQSALPPWLNSVLIDHTGSIWVASLNGLDRFERRSGRLAHYTEKDGLPSNAVDCILEDSSGDFWLGSGAGLSHFDPRREVFTNYTRADGLPGQDFTGWHACFRSESGEMFIGGFSGAVAFRPEKLATSSTFVPSIALTSFQLLGKPVAPGAGSPLARAIDYTDRLTLSHDQNSFSFEFSALSFRSPATNRYRYKLEGLDNNWQEVASDRRYASYTTLPAGTYRFRVQGATIRGPWSEPGAAVRIDILPPWWKTKPFLAALGTLLCLIGWVAYRLRLSEVARQVEARAAERTRIARELHDTLLQSLHGLLFQFQAVRNLFTRRPDEAMASLDSAIDDTERALAESRDAIQDLRSESLTKDSFPELLLAASRALANSGAADHEPPVFDIVEEGVRRTLSATAKNEISRIALEILRNAYRHAQATRVEAEIRYADDVLRVRIRDNGRGIDLKVLKPGGTAGHWGLRGVRERAERIGARLDFWSEAGAGTEVQLTVPGGIAFETSRESLASRLLRRVRHRDRHSSADSNPLR